jgi:hypothetical protein
VHRDVLAEIAFHIALLLDDLADAVDLVLVQVADLFRTLNAGGGENVLRPKM